MNSIRVICLCSILFASLMPRFVFAYHLPSLTVSIYSPQGTLENAFTIATANEAGGAKIAATDLGSDGVPEIVIGMGLGNEPRVNIYRADGSLVDSFLAYAPSMGTGITVAVCDVDSDGDREIVTGTQYGGGPQIGVWKWSDENSEWGIGHRFFAYDEMFRGGVNVSCGDLDGDGKAEIVTTPGPSGGPHVKVWGLKNAMPTGRQENWELRNEFFSFAKEESGGVVSAIQSGKLFLTLQKTDGARVIKQYVIHSSPTIENTVANNTVQTSNLFFVNDTLTTSSLQDGYITSSTTFVANVPFGSVNAASANLDSDGDDEIITVGDRPLFDTTSQSRIEIDLSKQRIYAFESGILANSFLISSAKAPWITPIGEHSVLAKLPYVDYTWSYGEGNPNNYSLGLVPYNLRIYPHVYIHYAYWHNNFGHPMSHGCVNVNLENMKWIYDWADVGMPVEVRT